MNKCHFIGRLTHDPITISADNTLKTTIEVAISRRFKRSDGTLNNTTDFIQCEAWDTGAEVIAKAFKRGDLIIIQATARSYDGQIIFRITEFSFPSACGL